MDAIIAVVTLSCVAGIAFGAAQKLPRIVQIAALSLNLMLAVIWLALAATGCDVTDGMDGAAVTLNNAGLLTTLPALFEMATRKRLPLSINETPASRSVETVAPVMSAHVTPSVLDCHW